MRLWELMVEFRVSINPDWWTKRGAGNFKWENPLPLEISLRLPSFPFSLSFFSHTVSFYLVCFHEELIRQAWEEGPVAWSAPLSLDGMSAVSGFGEVGMAVALWHLKRSLKWDTPPSCSWLFRALSQPVWLSPNRPCPVFIPFLPLFTQSARSLWSEIWFQRWSEPEAVASLPSSRPPGG